MTRFFIVSALLFAAMGFGICYCFVKTLPIGKIARRIAYGAVACCSLMAISYLPLRRAQLLPGYAEDVFAVMIGAVFVWFIAALFSDWAIRVVRRVRKDEKYSVKIRLAAIVASFLYLAYGVVSATTPPYINRVEIAAPQLKKPLTIAHLTDLHIGNGALLGESFAKRIADQTSALEPDIVAITGDLVDAPLKRIKTALKEIAKIKSKYGIYFVAGNHENLAGAIEAMDYLDSLGIKVLRNSSMRLGGDFGEIDIAGVLDYSGKRLGALVPDPKAALKDAKSENFILALAHQPNAVADFPENGFDLMLNGHTHGGQIFPFTIFVSLAQPYVAGVYRRDDRGRVFVSRGVGYWGPPIRVFAPNEIAFITLKPKDNL